MRKLELGFAALLALTVVPGPLQAQEPAPATVEVETRNAPHKALLRLGLVLFGGAYVGSAVVGAASPRTADRYLFIPVVGPVADLLDRGCSERGCGPDDDVAKSFLVASAVVQTAGIAFAVAALFTDEVESKRVDPKTLAASGERPMLAPVALPGGAGVTAITRF